MADAGVGMFVGRKNNCAFLALVYMEGRRGGTDLFVCLAFKNSLPEVAGGREMDHKNYKITWGRYMTPSPPS